MACAAADRGLVLWLLSDKERNGYELPLAMLRDPGNGYDRRTPLICAVSELSHHGEDVERREAFIYFLLDDLGWNVRDRQGRQSRDRVRRADDDVDEDDADAQEGFCILEAEDEMTSRSKSMIDTVKWLLDANPDTINARDQQGATVFSYVVKSRAVGIAGILAAVKVLLDARLRSLTLDPIHDEKPDQVDARTATTATSTLYPSWISPQSISVYLDNRCYPSGLALHERC
jgi:hypothetical protein